MIKSRITQPSGRHGETSHQTMKISTLAPETAAKLAAGEVIERPASVVRELVDNSIDAGASAILVVIATGGLDLIKVVDNGAGIEGADLKICTERHTTSKLRSIDDLSRLSSLGFRGEALHSITSVSRLRIRSRTQGDPGCEAEFEGLKLIRQVACGCPEGSQIEVRNLFFNTPARLKFLRGPTAEANRIDALMRRYILGRPHISFRLEIDGREALRSPGTGELQDALAAVYGWNIASGLVPVDAGDQAASLSGYVSAPPLSRSNRSDMHVFVNGRWVQSKSLLYAVSEAYNSLLMTGRFPLTVLSVQVPPDQLDVNVHPAKSDVRFADERGVGRLVGRAVRSVLLANAQAGTALSQPSDATQFGFDPEPTDRARFGIPQTTPLEPLGASASAPGDEPAGRLPPLRIIGQLASTYIIAEGPNGMCLIDQHAAHERVLLERLQNAGNGAAVDAQALLEPVVTPLSSPQQDRIAPFIEELSSLGFEAEPFGSESLLIRSVPASVPADRVLTLLEVIEEGLEGLSTAEERHRAMLATVACHSAVRAGQVLDLREMRALIQDLERTRVPTACAHGRPTLLELSRAELEREFRRR